MWPEPDARKAMERMFDHGPNFIPLSLLTRDDAIYAINQKIEAGSLIEKTSAQTQRPFRHALIRQEVNNMKGDTWPCVVFEEQAHVIYRFQNVQDLLRWLDGLAVAFSVIIFASRITQLLNCRGVKGEDCVALNEEKKIFYWARDTFMASQTDILSEQLQVSPTSQGSSITVDVMGNERTPGLQTMSIPAITRLIAGGTYGAAIARTGQLYIFLTSRPSHNSKNECTDPTPAEFYISASNPFTVCDPYTPCLARILDQDAQPTIIDVAVRFEHLVALTSEGEVFTLGDGMYGQLGVGAARQFDLYATKHQDNESEGSWEFAEYWQKIDIPEEEMSASASARENAGSGGSIERRVVAVQAGCKSTLLIVGDGR